MNARAKNILLFTSRVVGRDEAFGVSSLWSSIRYGFDATRANLSVEYTNNPEQKHNSHPNPQLYTKTATSLLSKAQEAWRNREAEAKLVSAATHSGTVFCSGVSHLFMSIAHNYKKAGSCVGFSSPTSLDGVIAITVGEEIPFLEMESSSGALLKDNNLRNAIILFPMGPHRRGRKYTNQNIDSCFLTASRVGGVCVQVDPLKNPKGVIEAGIILGTAMVGSVDRIPACVAPSTPEGKKLLQDCKAVFG